jgi:hypothetical protein
MAADRHRVVSHVEPSARPRKFAQIATPLAGATENVTLSSPFGPVPAVMLPVAGVPAPVKNS